MRAAAILVGVIALFQVATAAEGERDPLMLEEVLRSSATHFPAVLEGLAARRAAEGEAQAALGAFDLVFSGEASKRATGYYDGGYASAGVSKNLRALGATVYGGYRVSDGEFPVYEDYRFTNELGEAKAGVILSLLRDRAIDDRRFAEQMAVLGVEQEDLDLLLTRIGVQHRAQAAYWRWIAASEKLSIYEDLLRLAETRQEGLEERVKQGALARIFLTENQQNMVRRRILATEAQRDFDFAANALSFYWRGEDGAPKIPTRHQTPKRGEIAAAGSQSPIATPDELTAAALDRRPELALVELARTRAEAGRRLARNSALPQIDLEYELARDFGDIAEGGVSRTRTDNIVSLRFTQTLERNAARGKLLKAEADLEAARQRKRQLEDQVAVEIRNIVVGLGFAQQLSALAALEVDQAKILESAERERFARGASDFFLVNLREEATANAAIKLLEAELTARIAEADLVAATVDADALLLGDCAATLQTC